MQKILSFMTWLMVAFAGAAAYGVIALSQNEALNAVWILMAALCTYAIGYRFYSKWLAAKILVLNDLRATPPMVHEDGRDFVKTNKWILFGHHFAAISGPGPLVGPVLAAQFGYLPGTLWLLIGVVLGGAVQDFMILFFSMRRNGKSLGEMVKEEIGTTAGLVALTAIVAIIVILVAVLGLVVVKALAHSPWGTFTIAATMPIALFMGCYLRYLRPHRVLEVTVIGVALLLLSVWGGKFFHDIPVLAKLMTFDGPTLAWAIILYGLAASILPVWLLLAPRDYLSTFMKLGTIGALALGIFIILPPLEMPALTRFIDGTGPIFSGNVFPFCFITIACGAISGFHALIASGTTPKMILTESHARPIGYGSMLLESFVAIMAIIAACTLDPGIYFAINSPAAIVGATPEAAVATITQWGFPVTVDQMSQLANKIGENTLFGRTGGAPTLAVGMAHIFSQVIGGETLMALWYHFAIMFEALFILTTVDAGTRVGRFLLQAFLGHIWKPLGNTHSYPANFLASFLLVGAWGYFLYQGVIDPLGGINSLWPLFGIANQLLAIIALCLATTVLIKMERKKFLFTTLVPLVWLASITYTAGIQKIFHGDPKIGFLSQAQKLMTDLATGVVASDKIAVMEQMIFNFHLNAFVAGAFLVMVGTILILSAWRWVKLMAGKTPLDLREAPTVWLSTAKSEVKVASYGGKAGAILLLALDLVRHWAGQGSGTKSNSQEMIVEASVDPGRQWAEEQEERFTKPRCC